MTDQARTRGVLRERGLLDQVVERLWRIASRLISLPEALRARFFRVPAGQRTRSPYLPSVRWHLQAGKEKLPPLMLPMPVRITGSPAMPATQAPDMPPVLSSNTELAASSGYLVVQVKADFDSGVYRQVFAALQDSPRSKLLDLTRARQVEPDLFARLALTWDARPGSVPRLGILLPFEQWAVLADRARAALAELEPKGVTVEIFYVEQAKHGGVTAWFAHGRIMHNVAAVLHRLSLHWQPSANWHPVINALAALVRAHAPATDVPQLLIQTAGLAMSCGGGDETAALAQEALQHLPASPSKIRSEALRQLGTALLCTGDAVAGLAALDDAIAVAAATHAPGAEASALCQSGMYSLNHGDYLDAASRFRRAIKLLSPTSRRHLLAQAHHHLAIALMYDDSDAAEIHAWAALSLRTDQRSHWAEQDRKLLSRLQEAGSPPSGCE